MKQDSRDPNPAEDDRYIIPACFQQSAGFLLNRCARLIKMAVTTKLSLLRLSPPEVGLLSLLASEGDLSQHALGKRHNTDRSTIVELVNGLEKRDLVIRASNPTDRRSHLLHITPRGKKVLAQALRLVKKEQEKFLAPLLPEEWESVRVALVKLLSHHGS